MAPREATEDERNDPENTKLVADGFAGPLSREERKYTDVFFLLLLCACWAGMTFLGAAAMGGIDVATIPPGDPNRLLRGVDYDGRICGVSDGVTDAPVLYNLEGMIYVCVDECPTVWSAEYCVDVLGVEVCEPMYPTYEFMYRCIFTSEAVANQTSSTADDDQSNGFTEITADIYTAMGYIGTFGFVATAVFGLMFLKLVSYHSLVVCLVWGAVAAVLGLLAGAGALAQTEAAAWSTADPQTHSDSDIQGLQAVGYAFFVLAALWFVMICFLRKRINLAVSIVSESAEAITAMPMLIFFPVVQAAGVLLFMIPWIIFSLYLASSGEITTETWNGIGYKTIEYSTEIQRALVFQLFAFFWSSQFVVAVGQIVFALAISTWYFTRNRSTIGNGTIVDACRTAVKHAGTAAFGSLIIAIIKTVRAVVSYLQKKAEASQNKVMQYVLCIIQCYLWCLEKFMKFVNTNAYAFTAIFGTSFCASCKKTYYLFLRNILRVSTLSVVGNFVISILRVAICVAAALAAYFTMVIYIEDQVHSLVWPTLLVLAISWFVADMVTSVLDTALTTMLVCFVTDEEMFDGDDMYAPGSLRDCIDAASEEPAQGSGGKKKAEGKKYELTGQV